MTVPSAPRSAGPFVGNGVTTAFPFTFKVFSADDVAVYYTDSAGTQSLLTTNYTVALNADQDATPGGTVTYPTAGAALSALEQLALVGDLAYVQGTDITNAGRFLAQVVENVFDYLTILAQQLLEKLGRTLSYPVGDSGSTTLPTVAVRAGNFLAFDASGNPIAAAGTTATPVSAFMATVLDDITAAAARTTLGAGAAGSTLFTAATAAAARVALGVTTVGDALFTAATAVTARASLGFTSPVIDRAYAEYTANADLTTIIPVDDTIPQNTEGTQIISVSFTPKSITNRVRLRFQGQVSSSAVVGVAVALFSSASANALNAKNITATAISSSYPTLLEYEYVPGVTTALTFSVRVGPSAAATVRLNGTNLSRFFGGVSNASLVIEEIAA